ncbi:MAG TPA: hypothetical protein PKA77_13500 [Chitinophagaceae bacterium]|jgi:hypothetical protein|nr:hypothetical protein [Chitinophagaceae bacterium]HMU60014.1 hypothetical protein [Chitinophagaceae bacterium]
MKKIISVAISLLLIVYNYSNANENISLKTGTESNNEQTTDGNWTLSEYGFLIFPTPDDMEQFMNLIKTKTHAEAQAYLAALGFNSFGASVYGEEYSTQMVTAEQAINYVQNTARIFQISGIIIRPVNEAECDNVKWQYVLAMAPSNLTSESYRKLTKGTFDSNFMNRYATNPPTSDSLSLVNKMAQTNTGYSDEEPNPCPSNLVERRPFWGWSQATCTEGTAFNPVTNTWYTTYIYCEPSYYVFWIQVHHGNCTPIYAPCPPVVI